MAAITPFLRNGNRNVNRAGQVSTAWELHAPAASFAGMTLEEFREKIGQSQTAREKVAQAESSLRGAIAGRANADLITRDAVALVVSSIKGTPEFGPNSELYRACGYVTFGERASGLHRAGTMPEPTPSSN
jgi:hypothetical protein